MQITSIRLYKPAILRMTAEANRERARALMKGSISAEQMVRWLNGDRLIFNANNPLLYDAGTIGTMNGFGALLNSGFMEFWTGTQPAIDVALTGTKIAKLTFGASAFASATASGSGGSMSANAITSATALNTNTAGYFSLMESNDTTVVATGSVGTSGADINMSSLSISSGANVSCSSFVVTMPQT